MEYLWIIWVTVAVAAVVVEALLPRMIAVWIVPGAIASLVLSLFHAELWLQITVFLLGTAVLLLCARLLFSKTVRSSRKGTGVEAVIGEKCVVVDRIENLAGRGQVSVKGMDWSARTIDESEIFEAGDVVTVVAVEGVKLIVRR